MTFTRLRNLVDNLKRKYATKLAIYRARPYALELCDQMADAVTPGRPKPEMSTAQWASNLFAQLRQRGIRITSDLRLHDYLDGCLEKLLLPQVNDVLRSLFPKAAEKGLIPRSFNQVPFLPRREWKPGMGYFIVALADRARAARARGTCREPAPGPLPAPKAFYHRTAVPYLTCPKPRSERKSPPPQGEG